jgi:hypothetical protein
MASQMSTATQRAKIDGPDLVPTRHPFRVMQGETVIGQFSNVRLATDTAREHLGSVVLDVSGNSPVVVFRDGKLVE